jgi:TatD DNase family protein
VIDFHCHVDLFPDPAELIAEITRRRCYVLAVTTTPLAWEGTNRVVGDAPRVKVGLGLHPELVAQRHEEVDEFRRLLPQARYVGEIGLDGSARHRSSFELQQRVFRKILRLTTEAGGRIMSIHSGGAATSVLDEIERYPAAGTAVLHWFSGTIGELQRASDLGCWFSVGPAMLRTKKGRRLLEGMPPDRVLTESDGPFAQDHGNPVVPWGLDNAIRVLGEVWTLAEDDVHDQLEHNLRSLLGTPRHDASR